MPPELPAYTLLTAIDEARNIRRRYAIRVDRNLFGEVEVETSWGRIGARGQIKVARFTDFGSASVYFKQVMKRRATAHQRLGVPYLPWEARPTGPTARAGGE